MKSAELVIERDSSIRMIYNELVDPNALGSPVIRRGSHVEPTTNCGWTADLSPVGGASLGPFTTRSQALVAEVEWLRTHWLTRQHCVEAKSAT